jgi:hypothetical protein
MKNYLIKLSKFIESFEIPINEEKILNLLQIERRWPLRYPWNQCSVEVINNFGNNCTFGFFKENGFLNYDAWYEYYSFGYSTIISNILDLTPELRKLGLFLKKNVGSEINANFYLTKGNSNNKPSFSEHSHNYDVIVKQIYGSAYWKVDNKEILLKKDNVLIVNKNITHEVYKVNEPKLSLTINMC